MSKRRVHCDSPRGSIVVFDRGYHNYEWFKSLNDRGIGFVTRPRKNMDARVVQHRPGRSEVDFVADETIVLNARKPGELGVPALRRVRYYDADNDRHYTFVTNITRLAASTIAAIYKER